ncbi:MAG: ATP-binding protein [Clostridia bacterium]
MMMKEISLHILDIVQNSISAGAKLIDTEVTVQHATDELTVSITDDGCGMDEQTVEKVISPFTTSRTTRKVGLGIPFFKAGAEATGGNFFLTSKIGFGTRISATYVISNIDRPPLGDMAETMLTLAVCNQGIDFVYRYTVDEEQFIFDTREVREALGSEVPFSSPEVMGWMREYLIQGIKELNGGV